MRYFLIEEQQGSRDDTLGCGCRLIEIKRARSTEHAMRLASAVMEKQDDGPIADARILVVADEREIDLTELAALRDGRISDDVASRRGRKAKSSGTRHALAA